MVHHLLLGLISLCPDNRYHTKKFIRRTGDYTGMQSSRRFGRSADNRMLGGVCGGIGGYLQVNPTWIRIIWVVVTLFTYILPMIVLYVILWALLPEETEPMVIDADYRIRE